LILSIYHMLIDEKCKMNLSLPNSATIIPNLNVNSHYHDASKYPFSEIILNHPKSKPQLIRMSQAEICDDINASNRPTIFSYLMRVFNDWISEINTNFLASLCRCSHYIATSGYKWMKIHIDNNKLPIEHRRIQLKPDIVLLMLKSVNYSIYNNHYKIGRNAIEAFHFTAKLKLIPSIMVMCECILDNLNIETNMTSLRISHTNSSIKLNNTPRLQRANSHMKTTGITMQSIKHHKWNHFNEEVSADYMPSRLEIDEMQGSSKSNKAIDEVTIRLDNSHNASVEKSPSTKRSSNLKSKFKKQSISSVIPNLKAKLENSDVTKNFRLSKTKSDSNTNEGKKKSNSSHCIPPVDQIIIEDGKSPNVKKSPKVNKKISAHSSYDINKGLKINGSSSPRSSSKKKKRPSSISLNKMSPSSIVNETDLLLKQGSSHKKKGNSLNRGLMGNTLVGEISPHTDNLLYADEELSGDDTRL